MIIEGENYHMLSARRLRALEVADEFPAELRSCVHEYGSAIVQACLNASVTKPASIRQLVREIWEGARQPCQRRPVAGTLDWLLIQAGAGISAATLYRVLADNHHVVIPVHPTRAMLDASMCEVSRFNERVTKEEKHRRRLVAAIKAASPEYSTKRQS